MPSFIVKPKPDEDWYCVWSTIVDCPGHGGTREEILRNVYAKATPERLDRADEYGTSMCDPELPRDRQWFGWHDEAFFIREVVPWSEDGIYEVPRVNIRALCERLSKSEDVTDLLTFHPHEEENN